MKKFIAVLFSLTLGFGIFAQSNEIASEAYASFYGDECNGRKTANGEVYDPNNFTAAHRSLAFGTIVEVTNLDNGATVFVRINDRGPFVANREIDLSKAAANAIGMLQQGIARVSIKLISQPTATTSQSPANVPTQTPTPQPTATELTQNTYAPEVQYSQVPDTSKQVYSPAKKQKGLVLWRIQLGSFTREENALRLVESMREIGFEPAYEKTNKKVRVVLYGIRNEDLEKVKSVLKENHYVDYIIVQESW